MKGDLLIDWLIDFKERLVTGGEEAVEEQEHVPSGAFPFVFCRDEKHTRTPSDEETFHLSGF